MAVSCLLKSTPAILFVALVLNIVVLATSHWFKITSGDEQVEIGAFVFCDNKLGCITMIPAAAWLHIIQVCSVAAALLTISSMGTAIYGIVKASKNLPVVKTRQTLLITSIIIVILIGASLGLFAGMMNNVYEMVKAQQESTKSFSLGYSGIIALIDIALHIAIIAIVIADPTKQTSAQVTYKNELF